MERTMNYDMFKLAETNRKISEGHVKELVKSIEENGYIELSDIKVTKDYVIIDGQHRFEACKQLGLPILYTIVESTDIDRDIKILNSHNKNWSPTDIIEYYFTKGNVNYVQLYALKERLNLKDIRTTLNYMYGRRISVRCNIMKDLKNGNFKFSTKLEFNALKVKNEVQVLTDCIVTQGKKKSFNKQDCINAYLDIRSLPGFRIDNMQKKLTADEGDSIPLNGNVTQYRNALLKIYNFKLREKDRIAFHV